MHLIDASLLQSRITRNKPCARCSVRYPKSTDSSPWTTSALRISWMMAPLFALRSPLIATKCASPASPDKTVCISHIEDDALLIKGSAIFDFEGTGHEIYGKHAHLRFLTMGFCMTVRWWPGNLNAPRAVTMSAVIYCLRCLVRREIPLNQGCLNPVRVLIPQACNSQLTIGGGWPTLILTASFLRRVQFSHHQRKLASLEGMCSRPSVSLMLFSVLSGPVQTRRYVKRAQLHIGEDIHYVHSAPCILCRVA